VNECSAVALGLLLTLQTPIIQLNNGCTLAESR